MGALEDQNTKHKTQTNPTEPKNKTMKTKEHTRHCYTETNCVKGQTSIFEPLLPCILASVFNFESLDF